MPPAKLSTACGYPNRTKAEVMESKEYRERQKKKLDEGGKRKRKIKAGENMAPLEGKGPWLCHLPTPAFHSAHPNPILSSITVTQTVCWTEQNMLKRGIEISEIHKCMFPLGLIFLALSPSTHMCGLIPWPLHWENEEYDILRIWLRKQWETVSFFFFSFLFLILFFKQSHTLNSTCTQNKEHSSLPGRKVMWHSPAHILGVKK